MALTGLYGLDESTRVPLTLRVPTTITLAAGERRELVLDFEGTAPRLGTAVLANRGVASAGSPA